MSDEEFTRKVIAFLKSDYFHDRAERLLFEQIESFFAKYNNLPTTEALVIELGENDSINEEDFNEVLEGIYIGCLQTGMELIGGETAELPGIIKNGAFDVCGFGVGRVTDKLPMPDTMNAGDKLVGLPSSGFHSNGYTLIRQHVEVNDAKDFIYSLLEPTIIYNSEIIALKKEGIEIKGLAHITGDGYNNVNRVLPEHLYANIRLNATNETKFFRHEKLFQWIQKEANLTKKEMMATFNCGVGMVVIVPDDSDWLHLGHVLKDHLILGELEEKWDG